MSSWSISKRLNALSLVLVGALLLTTALGLVATLRLSSLFEDYRETSAMTLLLTAIQEDGLEAREQELHFRLDGDPADVEAFRENLEEIRVAKTDLASSDPTLREIRDAIMGTASGFDDYDTAFEDSVGLERALQEAIETARTQGKAMRERLTAVIDQAGAAGDSGTLALAASAQQNLILSRLYLERHFLAGLAEDAQEAERYKDLTEADLTTLANGTPGLAAIEARALLDELQSFSAAVLTAKNAKDTRDETRRQLDEHAGEVLGRVDEVTGSIVAIQSDLSRQGRTLARWTLALLVLVSLAAVAGGATMAISMSRRIQGAIAASIGQMQELAAGNLDVEITGTNADTELGRMAKTLEVFRQNAIEAKAADARQREQERLQRERDAERERHAAEAAEAQRRAAEVERREMIGRLQSSIGSVVDGAAAGDFSRRITERFAEEEFNRMSEGVNRLVSNVEAGVTEVARVMSRVAAGDLTERVGGDLSGLFAELKASVNETVDTLARIVDDIAAESNAVAVDVVAMAGQSDELARRAEQQAASLEETTAAMEEISAMTRSASEGATAAGEFAARTTGRVDEAGRVVATAVEAMDGIRKASARIGEIVSVIDGIAFQTNLLALNASVEAARAGSAGKGFSVVATEVRALAQRSAAASQDIRALIDESSGKVAHGVSLVEETGATLEEVVESVRGMAESLGKLVATGKEQAAGIQEVSSALSQLDVITQKNASLADQTREQTAGVKRRTETMRDLVAAFRTRASLSREAGSGTVGALAAT